VDKISMLPPSVSREASQGSIGALDGVSSPDNSPVTKQQQQQQQQQQQRSVSFAESTDDDAAACRVPVSSSSSRDRPSSTGSSNQQQQQQQQQLGDGNQPQHSNTSRGRLIKECAGLRNQVP
jgi:hypothetical protein